MTTVATHGFLSDESSVSVHAFESKYAELSAAYLGLGVFAHRAKYEFCGGGRNAPQILVALLFGRALSAYEATYLLASRGMEQDYQAILRTLLDTMFHALAAEKRPENARAIILAAEYQKQIVFEALLSEDKKANPAADHSVTEGLVDKARNEVKKSGAKKLSIAAIMAMADVPSWMYQLAYRTLCLSAHPDAARLQKALVLGTDGTVTQINWGPKYEAVELELAFAMDCLLLVLSCKSLGMPPAMIQEMEVFKASIDRIHRRLAEDEKDADPSAK